MLDLLTVFAAVGVQKELDEAQKNHLVIHEDEESSTTFVEDAAEQMAAAFGSFDSALSQGMSAIFGSSDSQDAAGSEEPIQHMTAKKV
mmetsp:Transcript_66727/g.118023  ORF Transcript_66727/g.118023 Transcript_66727/m.118023 type:complete len:88 (+) Transcript_66727:80-343(+)|eukprot:CAMPEP_0197652240 /NCGR_PEP_ID=MMETSP1338-20131121/34326_1 /TAXON_ID=43686 ORGANISM="Pelagodinium beii, Strain RCC1491" /NCGR_SAMPLE_ID=MMETSP1338 /ASSEMBLY_ACC=CAM_ASM_000754 /LENGTH=87 /DNA_ID=CAMNT_0043227067 /DNA_START=40 /DNA_END=303 /DNA_ORIENTATION=+